jgi:hypothetical protein
MPDEPGKQRQRPNDRSGDLGLNHRRLSLHQHEHGENQFGDTAEADVEQPANGARSAICSVARRTQSARIATATAPVRNTQTGAAPPTYFRASERGTNSSEPSEIMVCAQNRTSEKL